MSFLKSKSTDAIFLKEMAYKAYAQLNYADTVEMMLAEGNIRILLEKIEKEELEQLEDLARLTRENLDLIIQRAEDIGLQASVGHMLKLKNEIPETLDLVKIALNQDPQKVAEEIGKITAVVSKTNAFVDSFGDAVSLVGINLAKLDLADDVDKSKSLKYLIDMSAEGLPDEKTLRTAIEKSWSPPPEPEGIFAKIGKFFGFGDSLSKDKFVDDVMNNASFEVLVSKAAEIKSATADFEKAEKESEKISSLFSADIEQLSAGDTGALDTESLFADTGKTPPEESEEAPEDAGAVITKQQLKDIKTAMDQAKSKKKSQSKALGGSLNKIVGKPIFAESRAYTYSEVKQVLREVLISKRSSTGLIYDKDTKMHSEEEMIRYRMNKMAGLE